MAESEYSPEDLRRFVLGQMPREEFLRIASLRRSDPELDDAVELAESVVIDEYVENQLSPDEVEAFRNVFLTTEDRRERLAIAKGIQRIDAEERFRKQWRAGAVAVAIAAMLGAVIFQQMRAPQTVRLDLNNTKSANQQILRLADAPEMIVLEFECSQVPPTHTLTFGRLGDPKPLLTQRVESPASTIIKLPLVKATLLPGDYLAVLSAGEEFRADFRVAIVP